MLGWFIGPSKAPVGQSTTEGELTCTDDAPETPAPQFAIRALKSAFLGTPQTKQASRKSRPHASPQEAANDVRIDFQPEGPNTEGSPNKQIRSSRNDPLLSPTKGILVTPGTAANKRKTVSFGDFGLNQKDSINLFTGQTTAAASDGDATAVVVTADDLPEDFKKQPTLTKSAFESQLEASKRRIGRSLASQELPVHAKTSESFGTIEPSIANDGRLRETRPDTTLDLNVPCSRSGKHWKGEYDQYHRKSNREMRRLIQHGQTIKSYAQKKDWEAASLHEKLKRELAKVASMEGKVSELATELASIRSQGLQGNIDPGQLVTDLAKRTATAVRSKQKVEKYRAAIEEHNEARASHKNDDDDDDDDCIHITLPESPKPAANGPEMIALRSELTDLQSMVKEAEDKATKLEVDNLSLKQKMARVKAEMQSYEQRQIAREERLARKQAKLQAAKEISEAKFEQLKLEHEQLQHIHHIADERSGSHNRIPDQGNTTHAKNRIPTEERLMQAISDNSHLARHRLQHAKYLEERHAALGPRRRLDVSQESSKKFPLARSRGPLVQAGRSNRQSGRFEGSKAQQVKETARQSPEETETDIRAYGTQDSLLDDTLPCNQTPEGSDSIQLRRSTYAALQEISENSLIEPQAKDRRASPSPEKGASSPPLAPTAQTPALHSATRRMHSRRSTLASPRPSFLSMTSSAQKPDLQRPVPDFSNVWPDTKFSVQSAGTRTSTMGSKRSLPPGRAEAARKRLEAKRRENKTREEAAKSTTV